MASSSSSSLITITTATIARAKVKLEPTTVAVAAEEGSLGTEAKNPIDLTVHGPPQPPLATVALSPPSTTNKDEEKNKQPQEKEKTKTMKKRKDTHDETNTTTYGTTTSSSTQPNDDDATGSTPTDVIARAVKKYITDAAERERAKEEARKEKERLEKEQYLEENRLRKERTDEELRRKLPIILPKALEYLTSRLVELKGETSKRVEYGKEQHGQAGWFNIEYRCVFISDTMKSVMIDLGYDEWLRWYAGNNDYGAAFSYLSEGDDIVFCPTGKLLAEVRNTQ